MFIDNHGKVNESVTKHVVPEVVREGWSSSSSNKTFDHSFRIEHVDVLEDVHFLGSTKVVSLIPGGSPIDSAPVPCIEGVVEF